MPVLACCSANNARATARSSEPTLCTLSLPYNTTALLSSQQHSLARQEQRRGPLNREQSGWACWGHLIMNHQYGICKAKCICMLASLPLGSTHPKESSKRATVTSGWMGIALNIGNWKSGLKGMAWHNPEGFPPILGQGDRQGQPSWLGMEKEKTMAREVS